MLEQKTQEAGARFKFCFLVKPKPTTASNPALNFQTVKRIIIFFFYSVTNPELRTECDFGLLTTVLLQEKSQTPTVHEC